MERILVKEKEKEVVRTSSEPRRKMLSLGKDWVLEPRGDGAEGGGGPSRPLAIYALCVGPRVPVSVQ